MTLDKQALTLRDNAPRDELEILIREASQAVEDDLALEDAGWINLSGTTADVITPQDRVTNLKLSRLYATKDPMGKQAIRLWTDYTFGSGMTWRVKDEKNEKTKEVLESFWDAPANKAVLSARGQRRSSDKLLIEGDVFFAIFLGTKGEAKIRLIDPLEITEIITNLDDIEDVRYYRRDWTNQQAEPHISYYRSVTNLKDESTPDAQGTARQKTDDALVYHLTYNTITQRGNPLLLPALIWMKYNTKFLGSRIAIMLALAKFAWRSKVKGGQTAVDAIKAKTDGKEVAAASHLVENLGVDTTPIKTETGAGAAYQDGKMIKHMIFAAVGIPEQYFGDISTGNLATAKTVELPMMKMFQSYQKVWADTYKDINEIVLAYNNVPDDKWYVDMDFPPIAPADEGLVAQALSLILPQMPQLADSPDVQQVALMLLGIDDTAEVLDALSKATESNPEVALTRVLKQIRETLSKKE